MQKYTVYGLSNEDIEQAQEELSMEIDCYGGRGDIGFDDGTPEEDWDDNKWKECANKFLAWVSRKYNVQFTLENATLFTEDGDQWFEFALGIMVKAD